jgi:TonB family protein
MARANADDPAEVLAESLGFLNPSSPRVSSGRVVRAAAGSVAVHILIAAVILSLPDITPVRTAPVIVVDVRKAVPLVAPRSFELTQKDPNRGKVSKSLDIRSALPPAPVPSAPKRYTPPAVNPGPPAQSPPPAPAPPVIEAPSTQIAANAVIPGPGLAPQLPPPPPAPEKSKEPAAKEPAKPKLAFESIARANITPPANPGIPVPRTSVSEAAQAARRPIGGAGISVGDPLEEPPTIAAPTRIPTPGQMGSNLQLLSDPGGVDFKPYMIQVLAAVRQNWLAVIPESARMGRRGLVTIQFIINRKGEVPKLVIATPSGTPAFDRAAVAGVSASYPFPPLPAGYKGDEIRLQLAFSYNMSR